MGKRTPNVVFRRDQCPTPSDLNAVLAHIDADLDNSLERLFALLRIKSISTDPAYAGDCQARRRDRGAAISPALGFDAECARPAAIRWWSASAQRHAARACCSTATTTCSRSIRSSLWEHAAVRAAHRHAPDGRKVIVARGASDDKGQLMTFVEACRAWKAVTGGCRRRHHPDRGRGGMRLEAPAARSSKANKDELRADFALVCDTGMWDPTRRRSPPRCAASSMRR